MKAFFLLLFLPLSLFATLSSPDVHKAMDQLFGYHVDHKEMSPVIIERSLKIYIDSFDFGHTYLLAREVNPYLKPSHSDLQKIMSEYKKGNYSTYFALNETIQEAIGRSRSWRAAWSEDPQALIAKAKGIDGEHDLTNKNFLNDEKKLKERYHDYYLRFVAFQIIQQKRSLEPEKAGAVIALCEKQLRMIENGYLGLDDQGKALKSEEQNHQVHLHLLKAMAHSLDAHTAYYSPEEALAMKVQLEKGMCGLGVVLHEGIDGVVIADLLKGGPAERQGNLRQGDTIIEIDGESIDGYSFAKVMDMLRGQKGSKTVLGVLSGEEQKFQRVQIIREMISIEEKRVDVSSEPCGDGIIGKLTLHSFYEGDDGISSEKDLQKAIEKLKAEGPLRGLVLDMRDNSGGFLSQAVRVSGLFISSGVVLISKYSGGVQKYYRAVDGNRQFDGPLVVLISRGSASATEIVAQCLQDYGVAVVVGDTQTYGKGTIQHQTVTNDKTNSFFKVTVGRYYSVSGKSPQINGVRSDIEVPTVLNFEEVGEGYIDNPLTSDQVDPAFEDPLSDVDPYVKRWFSKFYLPSLQPKIDTWSQMIPTIRANSQKRMAQNPNYTLFLKKIKKEVSPDQKVSHGQCDLQMEESVNIVKDMIFLQK